MIGVGLHRATKQRVVIILGYMKLLIWAVSVFLVFGMLLLNEHYAKQADKRGRQSLHTTDNGYFVGIIIVVVFGLWLSYQD